MSPQDANNPVWRQLVTGEKSVTLSFLAAKILLSRLQLKCKQDASTATQGAKDIFEFYLKNQKMPSAQKDLEMLLG